MKRIISLFAATLLFSACPGGGDGSGSDAPFCPEPEVLSGDITTEVTIGEACRNVLSTNGASLSEGGTLRIAPGTTVTFGSGASLHIGAGALIAEGTEDAPIVFTGQEEVPGYWQGLVFYRATSTKNVLSHVVVESAGGSKYVWAAIASGVTLVGSDGQPTRVKISNSVFRRNQGVGLSVHAHTSMTGFSGNEMTENVEGAAFTHVSTVSQLTPDNDYVGNQQEVIRVQGGDLTSEVTMHELGVPYLTHGIDVVSGGKLSIEPGVKVRFTANGRLYMSEGGRLEAVGTETAPITFEGEETVPGYWTGIIFYKSGSTENVLDHVNITDAGGEKYVWAAHPASVVLAHADARTHLSNTVIDRGEGYALYVHDLADVVGFSQNVLTGHSMGAAYVSALSASWLSSNSAYTGNATGRDRVVLSGTTLSSASTLNAIDVPYVLGAIDVADGGHLTIEPGNTLQFETSGGLNVSGTTARITAVGTSAAPIIFTRVPDAASWKGLHVYKSTAVNRIEHAEISFGGQSKYTWASNAAGLSVASGVLEVSNVRISNSVAYGLDINGSATVTGCATVTYENNASGNQSGAGTCG